ncbi:MAG: polysaccharide deacetylase family protein [Candidatus Omnitrophica bacterium]|nr:polysaccharide deacetylase family protein [Candidatus Omnitrophota bacterium]
MKKILKFSLIFLFVAFLCFWGYIAVNWQTPILMYHAIDKSKVGKYAAVSPEVFYQQMKFIHEKQYTVMSLDDYCQAIIKGTEIPRDSVVITFDDGYKDNLEATRILKLFRFPATIFIIPEKLGKEDYLTPNDVRWFLKDTPVKIGSHTLTHAYLPAIDATQLKEEIHASKHNLQDSFDQEIKTIAFPLGAFDKRVLEEVKNADYLCACSTNRGYSNKLNRFALRRIKVTNRDLGIRLWAKLSGFYNIFKKVKDPY